MHSSLAVLSHTASWYRLIQQLGIMLFGGQFGALSIVDLVVLSRTNNWYRVLWPLSIVSVGIFFVVDIWAAHGNCQFGSLSYTTSC